MKKWLFNPFVYIAGIQSLLLGWAIMLATAGICYFNHAHFDGVIDIHVGRTTPLATYFLEQLTDWGCMVLLCYAAALIFSRSGIRFIDVAGTLALARWVMIVPALLAFAVKVPASTQNVDEIIRSITPVTITIGLLFMAFSIWMIALSYNAFKVSCNMKGGKATVIFIIVILLAEMLAYYTDHQLYKHLN